MSIFFRWHTPNAAATMPKLFFLLICNNTSWICVLFQVYQATPSKANNNSIFFAYLDVIDNVFAYYLAAPLNLLVCTGKKVSTQQQQQHHPFAGSANELIISSSSKLSSIFYLFSLLTLFNWLSGVLAAAQKLVLFSNAFFHLCSHNFIWNNVTVGIYREK